MEDPKFKKLRRGYVLTDFDGKEIGCKESLYDGMSFSAVVLMEDVLGSTPTNGLVLLEIFLEYSPIHPQ
jgi:hypothetical protein